MKVALIIERIETWRGGAETSTMQFAGYLARDGCRVHVVTTTNMPSTPELDIVPIRASRAFRGARTLMFARRAAAYVRQNDFDVVHCITPCLAADVYQPRGGTVPETLERNAAIRRTDMKRGLKRVAQGLNFKYLTVGGLERRLLNRRPAPWVIAISDYVCRQLEHHYRFDPSHVERIFNGVDPDMTPEPERQADRTRIRRQFGLGYDDPVILCVAHNFKLKGVGALIEALARPAARGSRLLVVGRDNPTPYAELARRLGVTDRVIFSGPTQRIQPYFHAADLLAHPTYYDPCSRVVLEALASGLPVVTTRFNGAAERITDGEQGYVVDSPEEIDALADRIGRLLDAGHNRACSERAPRAVDGISMKEHAQHVRRLYERLIERGQTLRRQGH